MTDEIIIHTWSPVDNIKAFDISIHRSYVESGKRGWLDMASDWLGLEFSVDYGETDSCCEMIYCSKDFCDEEYEKERIMRILKAAHDGEYRPGEGWPRLLGSLYFGIGIDAIIESRAT